MKTKHKVTIARIRENDAQTGKLIRKQFNRASTKPVPHGPPLRSFVNVGSVNHDCQ